MSSTFGRAVDAAGGLGQSNMKRFQQGVDWETYHLDCEDCVHFVDVSGVEEDAIACARRHVEKKPFCESVTVTEADSRATICRVRADGVEDLREVETS